MSIVKTDIKWRKSEVMSGGYEIGGGADPSANAANGGIMLATEAITGVKNAIMPDAQQSELTAGSVIYRKVFLHISNAWNQGTIETAGTDLQLVQPRVFVETYTPGDDSLCLVVGTATDTQSSLTGTEDLYGAAQLDADVSASATSLDVYVEDDEDGNPLVIFRIGDLVRVSDKTDVEDTGGNEEFVTLTGVGAFTGNVQTLTFSGDPLENAYDATTPTTRVTSVIEPATVVSSFDTVTSPTGSGTFNSNIFVNNLGCVEDTWTVEFDNATQYHVTGTKTGLLAGTGAIGSDFSPQNTDYGTNPPYFVIKGAGNWGGTWADGDTFTFKTHIAAIPVWYRRMIPADTASLTANKVIVGINGQST